MSRANVHNVACCYLMLAFVQLKCGNEQTHKYAREVKLSAKLAEGEKAEAAGNGSVRI